MEDNMWWYGILVFMLPIFLTIIELVQTAHDRREELLKEHLKLCADSIDQRAVQKISAAEINAAINKGTDKPKTAWCKIPDYHSCIEPAPTYHDELHSILDELKARPQRIVHRTNCPNCGAPLNDQGKCEYCTTITDRNPVVKEKKPDTIICEHGSNGFDELKLYADDKVIARTVIDKLNGIGWS